MAIISIRISLWMFVTSAAATELTSCKWSNGKLHVTWAPPENFSADYYELQVSTKAGGKTYAVYSTAKTEADLDFLNGEQTIFLKVRAHIANMPSLGPGTWREPGNQVECRTGATPMPRKATLPNVETFMLEVMRESEFTDDVDYLMNHNSGDIEGDVGFITMTASSGHFSNSTFNNSVFTLYCVEVLKTTIPDTMTTDGDDRFADYLSCNDNGNATDPQCMCDNAIDRFLSKPNGTQLTACKSITTGAPCDSHRDFRDCKCNCSSKSLDTSAKYTGMMPLYFKAPVQIGVWYSHPKNTECSELETVGQPRADGSICTWKRNPEARVLRGHDALKAGWNTSVTGHAAADPAQVHQNTAIIRKVFNGDAFQRWSCTAQQSSDTLLV